MSSAALPAVPPTDPLVSLIVKHEGLRLSVYPDSLGYLTIGFGRLIDSRKGGGISTAEAYLLLSNDIRDKKADLDTELPWWRGLDQVRQDALVDLTFDLGIQNLLGFTHALSCLAQKDYQSAAEGFRNSLW